MSRSDLLIAYRGLRCMGTGCTWPGGQLASTFFAARPAGCGPQPSPSSGAGASPLTGVLRSRRKRWTRSGNAPFKRPMMSATPKRDTALQRSQIVTVPPSPSGLVRAHGSLSLEIVGGRADEKLAPSDPRKAFTWAIVGRASPSWRAGCPDPYRIN